MDESDQFEDSGKFMAPSNFSLCRCMSCQRTVSCTIKTLVFVGLVVVVGISFSLSPGYGAIDGFDLITSSSTAMYDFMVRSPENVQQIAGMILLPFYILIATFVVVCVARDDTWLMITAINGWIGALVICLTIGIPINEQRIRYWETGVFPLEYLLSDNTVNTHVVISFICSHSVADVLGTNRAAKAILISYNILLALFTVVTRCSSPPAVLIALLVGSSAIYFNRTFNAKWLEFQRDLATGKPVGVLGCLFRQKRSFSVTFDQETDSLRNGSESSAPFDTTVLQYESFNSLLRRVDRNTGSFEVGGDGKEEEKKCHDSMRKGRRREEEEEKCRGDLDLSRKNQQREEMPEDTEIQSSSLCVAAEDGEIELESINPEEEESDEQSDTGLDQ